MDKTTKTLLAVMVVIVSILSFAGVNGLLVKNETGDSSENHTVKHAIPVNSNKNSKHIENYKISLTRSGAQLSNKGIQVNNYPISLDSSKNQKTIPSPLEQFQRGVPADKIRCKVDLVLIQKYDGSPACVKHSSMVRLIQIGWIKMIDDNDKTENSSGSNSEHIVDKQKVVKSQPRNKTNAQCKGEKQCLINATVTGIVDGDTIYVDNKKVRLSLVDTPEFYESGYQESVEFTKSLCPKNSHVTVDQDDLQPYDSFGRMLGKITCEDNSVLNAELVYSEHATILERYCKTSEFGSENWASKHGCSR